MEEWLKQNGYVLGNSLLCIIGLIFAIGAPIKNNEAKKVKVWWVIFWTSLLSYYILFSVFVSIPNPQNVILFLFLMTLNAISNASVLMLYFYISKKKSLEARTNFLKFFLIILLNIFLSFLSTSFLGFPSYFFSFLNQFLSWIFFVLLAWAYRTKHMATTLLLLAYANLQLPAGFMGKEGWNVDFILLLAAKLTLVGAMYHTLGIRDEKEEPLQQSK